MSSLVRGACFFALYNNLTGECTNLEHATTSSAHFFGENKAHTAEKGLLDWHLAVFDARG
jgi:hypothetical protein